MGSKPITQKAATKYGSAPVNNEVTVDAAGKEVARFPRMSPLKQIDLVKGARDVGDSQNRPATWTQNETTEGEPTVKKGKEKTRNLTDKEVWDQNKDGVKSKYKDFKDYQGAAQKHRDEKGSDFKPDQVGTGEFEPDEVVPGEKKTETYQGDLYAAQSGTATSSYGGRSDRRNVKATTKDQYKNKLRGLRSKIGSDILDAEGKPTGQKYTREQFKKDKQAARTQMFENRQTAFDAQEANLQRQIEQGRVKGESYRRPDRVKTYGDYENDDSKQMSMGLAQQKADRARNQAAAAETRKKLQQMQFQVMRDNLDFEPTSGLDYKTNTPSLTKPKSLMYDLSSIGGDSPSPTQPFSGLSEQDMYELSRSGIQKRGYKMGGFGSKNKK